YRERLMEVFAASAEAQELSDQDRVIGWAETFMEYGLGYLGVTPADMTPEDVRAVLFDLFPRKVSAEPGSAQEIVGELRAFWHFLGRAFALPNAAACARVLDSKAARTLEQAMANPANFGMAKALVMQGAARGFDMTTEEGLNAWMTTYNAEVVAQREAGRAPSPLGGGMPFLPLSAAHSPAKKASAARQRKLAQESRKQNRKKS
ncbi:MAG TPA: hypothetical protein VKC57_12210, partial [Ktedonobacterales bacterium]|nr:hypothetical protein [Ktedonobacterales bacterium]